MFTFTSPNTNNPISTRYCEVIKKSTKLNHNITDILKNVPTEKRLLSSTGKNVQ
jgi:hypothetical protein